MMKFEKIRAARQDARKRGAEMTGALLWAAFAIGVLISILGVYQVVQLNSNKTAATRTVSTVSNEARGLFRNAANFADLDNDLLIAAGAVTNDAFNGDGDITLAYGTTLDFLPATGDNTQFQMTITPGDGIRAGNLCTFLISGDKGTLINGPLGSDYSIPADTTCGTAPIVVTYAR